MRSGSQATASGVRELSSHVGNFTAELFCRQGHLVGLLVVGIEQMRNLPGGAAAEYIGAPAARRPSSLHRPSGLPRVYERAAGLSTPFRTCCAASGGGPRRSRS